MQALPLVLQAAAAATTTVAGIAQLSQARATMAAAEAQATRAKLQAERDALEVNRKLAATLGRYRALMASAGVTPSDAVQEDLRRQAVEEKRAVMLRARLLASDARAAASTRATGQILSGISTIGRGLYQGFDLWRSRQEGGG